MRAALLALFVIATTASAEEPLLSGPELMELRYACFGDDANAFTGSRADTNDACRQWDEIQAQAREAGLCLDEADDFSWKPCT